MAGGPPMATHTGMTPGEFDAAARQTKAIEISLKEWRLRLRDDLELHKSNHACGHKTIFPD